MHTYTALAYIGILLIVLLLLGTIGFRYFAHLEWIDAFETSTYYVTGLGTNVNMPSTTAKLWGSLFAIITTVFLLGIAVNVLAYIIELKYIRK